MAKQFFEDDFPDDPDFPEDELEGISDVFGLKNRKEEEEEIFDEEGEAHDPFYSDFEDDEEDDEGSGVDDFFDELDDDV